jgi:hypothetical protein
MKKLEKRFRNHERFNVNNVKRSNITTINKNENNGSRTHLDLRKDMHA